MKQALTKDEIKQLTDRLLDMAKSGRHLVAIAGAPGSGKSTLSDSLCAQLNAARPGVAAVVPMDGYHFDDAVLREKGTLARKGAPFTFDVGGLKSMLTRLRANEEAEIAVPVFDRPRELSRAGARLIQRSIPLLLVEGNYLLLDQKPWSDLRPLFDLTVRIEVPMAELERRLLARWLDHGYSRPEAEAKARGNDLPNAETVAHHWQATDLTLVQGQAPGLAAAPDSPPRSGQL
ncbi:MAG: nucleoside triphosphate hydrolase [Paracoccus sp. (in: a-proteobacteria)]